MTRILVLATGGTIASRPGADGVAPTLAGAELVEAVLADDPDLRDTLRVSVEEPFRRPSYTLGPAVMLRLAHRCRTALAEGHDAVVVLHGTDTVADSAWLTHLLTLPVTGGPAPGGPVVFTSAMRHAAETGADGPRNLLDALRVAGAPGAAGRGAMLVVNGEIHAAARVVKSHTSGLHAFASPGSSPLGDLTAGIVRFTRPAARPFPDPGPVEELAEIGMVPAWAGHGDVVIGALLDRGVRGLVVEGTGAGHVHPDAAAGLERAFESGVPVTVTSRASGPVHRAYGGGPGSGRWLAATPALDSGELGTARALLALAVGIATRGTGPELADWWGAVVRHQAGLE
ncbi:asparaginase [Raineyella sp. W15-4]|uniref:asparaginase n=1 Tax=Raineyella sp. W15-4 TaxID=3081651 RepID=UPI002954BBA2|nr:asparaginase [Raineyella sp. W15-4]WOQ17396.1 asparaginase [Raineyella sp. W15-4]